MKTNAQIPMAVVALAMFTASTARLQAQFNYLTNNGTITITTYTGRGGDVTIPSTINGLPVTSISYTAFYCCTGLTSITIPDSVINMGIGEPISPGHGEGTFTGCTSLTNAIIGNSVAYIGDYAFEDCVALTTLTIGGNVTNILELAFRRCSSLTSVTFPASVTSIGEGAFNSCTSLTGAYFKGNAPSVFPHAFVGATNATVYYLPGTIGWDETYGERPTAPWLLPYPAILTTTPNFGIQANQFGFRISWATNTSVVVEASSDLSPDYWLPVSTNALVDGWSSFSDAKWTNYAARFYRVRSQ